MKIEHWMNMVTILSREMETCRVMMILFEGDDIGSVYGELLYKLNDKIKGLKAEHETN
ncbi:MAG: hypothetical protein JKY81_05575 [Colwellia sp.]|nr:hypothetical protein [Colwellia sp.]